MTSLADLKAKYGALTGSAEEYELLDPTSTSARRRTTIAGQEVYLPDYYRESGKEGTFTNITNPFERAQAQAELKLAGQTATPNTAFDPAKVNLEGDLEQLSTQYNVGQNVIVEARKAAATTPVLSETGAGTDLEIQSFAERSALPATTLVGVSGSYFDASRGDNGVEVYAKPGEYFELYQGGGVRAKQGAMPAGATGAPPSSLFTQPTTNEGTPIEGFKGEQLGITPAEGKTIARTGRTGKNPETGVDVPVGPDEIFVQYTDGTFEVRKVSSINEPGEARPLSEAGPTAEELGITRRTEIKGGEGAEVTRAPMSAAEALKAAQTPEEMDQIIQQEGLKSTEELEYIGNRYDNRVAGEGNAFYQDPETKKIVERPEALKDLAKPTTSPSILASRNDIKGMFEAVFGREPSAEELKYWQGRTDKTGAALIGAMQFAKNQGNAIGTQAQGEMDPISAINSALNNSQKANLSRVGELTVATDLTSKSAQLIDKLMAGINQPQEPPSLAEEYQKQMSSTGYNEDAAALTEAERSLKQLDADFASTLEGEEGRRVSMSQIRRRQSQQEINYNRIRRDLQVERDYLANKVANKQAIVNTMVSLMGQDISNAQAFYQNQFSNAISLTNLMRQVEQDQLTMIERQKDEARANLQVMTNLLSSGNVAYGDLDASTQSQIRQMEVVAGMPSGFTQFVGEVTKDPVVNFGSAITRQDGTVVQPVFTIDPATGEFKTTYISHGKERIPASGGGDKGLSTTQQLDVQQKFFDDLEKYATREASSGQNYGRERIADQLIAKYGNLYDPASIESDVYNILTPGWEGRFKSAQKIDINNL